MKIKKIAVFAIALGCASFLGLETLAQQRMSRGANQRRNRLQRQSADIEEAANESSQDKNGNSDGRAFDGADAATPKATITLKNESGQKLTDAEWLEAIEVVLEMNGIHLEPYGEKFIRALPRKEVRKEGIPLLMDQDIKLKDDGKVVSMMIELKHISYEEAQKALENFKSASGNLMPIERINSILVTDTKQNINRMLEIVKAMDIASPVMENVFVRQIKNAAANDIKTALEAIVQESQKELEKNGKAPQPQQNHYQPRTTLLGLRRSERRERQEATPAPTQVVSVSDADRGMIRGKVLILADERSNKLIIVTQKSNMDFFDKVIEQLDVETTPDTVVKVYRLKYAEAEEVSDMINDLIGNAPNSKNSGKQNQNQAAKSGSGGNLTRSGSTPAVARKSANQRSGDAKAGELSKDNTTVLADKRINGLVVMTNKELVPVVENIIESMDVKLSQVLIETCIIEVSLDDGLETGIDWVQRGRHRQQQLTKDGSLPTLVNSQGQKMYYATQTRTDEDGKVQTKLLSRMVPEGYSSESTRNGITTKITASTTPVLQYATELVRDGFVNNGHYMLGGGAGSAAGQAALNSLLVDGSVNPAGGGINYYLKSDKLNIASIIKAVQTDSRTKYIASPVVMTVDNKEAVINATKMRYLLKGFTSSGNSYSTIAVPDYEQKELGIEIKVTPKINPNGTVMLKVEEKYSQISGSQDIKYATGNSSSSTITDNVTGQKSSSALETVTVDTTATREMSADVILENMQTVVFGGLTETLTSEKESGIPILKDIPWIGKWLFGSVSQSETRSELLVFMTPYVLDDAEATQAEAIRRKKALSDSRPWDDHGWSASNLADPVSKKEQMRRLKEEWAKQDEERQTKLAIEKMKVERAKKLKALSKEEREVWLKMHKEELEEEQQEELEKKMLDEKSQEELKTLVEKIKKDKLGSAQQEIDKAEEMTRSENERAKLDKAKAEKEAAKK